MTAPRSKILRQAAYAHTLRACQLFSGLPPETLEAIAQFCVPRRLAKGDFLFYEGGPTVGFYVVQSGAVCVHRVNAMGKEHVIAVFRAGQSFAEAALASAGGYPANARAVENTAVLLVPQTPFTDMLRHSPELALRMLGAMSLHLRELVSRLDDLTLKDVESRLAHWLLKQCPRPLTDACVVIRLGHTKRVLASELGTVGETLSRTLAKWRTLELVRVLGNSITVISPLQLDALLRRNLGD
ncbi:MAG: Crp/Fnr family transcriptional regulator [Verrucomicrobiota bacterium]